MRCITWLRRASWPLALGVIVLTGGAALADDEAPPADQPPKREPPPPPGERPHPPEGPRERIERIIERYVPGYHLGVSVGRVPVALDAQLELKGEGVLITGVNEGLPAEKAGVKANDVVLAIGDKPLKDPEDLAQAAQNSEGKELTLKLMRAGKPMTVTVTPEKSEATYKDPISRALQIAPEIRVLEEKIREKLKDAGVDMRMQLIQPGAFLPKGVEFLGIQYPEFPDDLTVKINKQGKNPAEIEVKKGDKTWTVKEDKLAELPQDVRKHVEGLLGRGPMAFNIVGPGAKWRHPEGPGDDEVVGPPPADGPEGPGRPRPPRGDRPYREPEGFRDRERGAGGLERRLEEMTRRMQQMQEQFESLRRHLREDRNDRPGGPERPDRPERPERPDRPDGPPPGDK